MMASNYIFYSHQNDTQIIKQIVEIVFLHIFTQIEFIKLNYNFILTQKYKL